MHAPSIWAMHAQCATGVSVPRASRFRGRPAAAAAVSAIANMYIPARLLLRMTAASLRLSGGVSQHQHQADLQPRHADRRRQHAPASYVKNTPTSGGGKAVLGRAVRAPCEYEGYEYDERGWIRSNTAGECPLEHWLERQEYVQIFRIWVPLSKRVDIAAALPRLDAALHAELHQRRACPQPCA